MRLKKFITPRKGDSKKALHFISIWPTVQKACAPFIKELKSTKSYRFLYRGTEKRVDVIRKIRRRKDRTPKDMPYDVHTFLDDSFERVFGWNARSEGVFTTSSSMEATTYGDAHMFFPIGKYNYVWSKKHEDLYSNINDTEYIYDDYSPSPYEYEQEYGEDSGNGTWVYDEHDTGESDFGDAEEKVMEEVGEDEIDSSLFEWEPEIQEDEWEETKLADWNKEREEFLEGIVDDYTDRNLKGAMDSKNEIMFDVDKFYLIHESYESWVEDAVFNNKMPLVPPEVKKKR